MNLLNRRSAAGDGIFEKSGPVTNFRFLDWPDRRKPENSRAAEPMRQIMIRT
jgi:hypothetical protein